MSSTLRHLALRLKEYRAWQDAPGVTLDREDLLITPGAFDLLAAMPRWNPPVEVDAAEFTSTPEPPSVLFVFPFKWWQWPLHLAARVVGRHYPPPIRVWLTPTEDTEEEVEEGGVRYIERRMKFKVESGRTE
jgi:hypothetical protein